MPFWPQNVKLTAPLVAAIEFGASSYPRKVPSKVEKTNFEKIMKLKIYDTPVLAYSGPWR